MIDFSLNIDLIEINKLKENSLKSNSIEKDYSFGRRSELSEHLDMLKEEFGELDSLEYYHAGLITHIRRKVNIELSLYNFKKLWEIESQFLLKNLDSRWLVSACDTIVDHFDDPSEVNMALAGAIFANTIKLYETERFITNSKNMEIDVSLVQQGTRVPLFDGMSAFVVGHGDMVLNLERRVRSIKSDSIAINIVKELFSRAHTYDTVYKRFYDMHVNAKTLWRY